MIRAVSLFAAVGLAILVGVLLPPAAAAAQACDTSLNASISLSTGESIPPPCEPPPPPPPSPDEQERANCETGVADPPESDPVEAELDDAEASTSEDVAIGTPPGWFIRS